MQRTLRERGQHPLEPSSAFPEPSQHSRAERNAARERNALDALAASPPTPQTRLGPFLPLHRPPRPAALRRARQAGDGAADPQGAVLRRGHGDGRARRCAAHRPAPPRRPRRAPPCDPARTSFFCRCCSRRSSSRAAQTSSSTRSPTRRLLSTSGSRGAVPELSRSLRIGRPSPRAAAVNSELTNS